MISVIVRTKNEEKWLSKVLFAVQNQDVSNIEVIVVDSGSTDRTLEIAESFSVKIIQYKGDYFPGKSINCGIAQSSGDYITILSAHCIPVNDKWLERLKVCFMESDKIAAVYGKQEPFPDSNIFDKRDLWTVFGKERRIQKEDYFFHNANSMIRRDIWEKDPFNENLLSLEDQAWAQKIIQKGYRIFYEPHASVYHYHGIHQGYNLERTKRVMKVVENLKKNEG